MKKMKCLPALVAALVLGACSTASDVVTATTDAAKNVATGVKNGVTGAVNTVKDEINSINLLNSTKSVVYQCQNNTKVSAAYVFDGKKATSVTLMVGSQPIGSLALDKNAPNPQTFSSDAYRWHTDAAFSLDNFDKSDAVMLFKLGGSSDEILAKNCKIDAAETKILNKTK